MTISPLPAVLEHLWRIAGGDPRDPSHDWNQRFDPIGLILFAPPRHGGYWCTPLNSTAFATTGGDGVHFSWVQLAGRSADFCPIVMTVPMGAATNLIVGANLREFLALGSRCGYFGLEQLVYDRTRAIEQLASDPDAPPAERTMLAELVDELALKPWADPQRRLIELQREFLGALLVRSNPDEELSVS